MVVNAREVGFTETSVPEGNEGATVTAASGSLPRLTVYAAFEPSFTVRDAGETFTATSSSSSTVTETEAITAPSYPPPETS